MRGDFSEVTYGYCKCGCGEKTAIAIKTSARYNHIKGEPVNFLPGHNARSGENYGRTGKDHPSWKGGNWVVKRNGTNYIRTWMPSHHRSNSRGYVLEHILVAEKTLGNPLPKGAVVHHIDFNGLNNDEDNLMIFESSGEHTKFHAALRKK